MSGNFRVKCIGVDNHRGGYYTVGKIYNVVDGVLKSDYNAIIFRGLKALEDLQEKSSARWELVEEKENNMVNFKARCIDTKEMRCYTRGKVYDIINNTLISDFGNKYFTGKINSFKDLEGYSMAKWELIDEHKTKLTITIDDKISTISDGNAIFEVENDNNIDEVLVEELVKKYYYNHEKNKKIRVGDNVSITDTICYPYYKEFIVANSQELIDRMGLVEFSNLLLNFKSGDSPCLNGKYEVSLIAKHTRNDEYLAIISNANNTFIISIDNLKKIKNQIGVNKYE